ncbi:bifunctional protein tyrosine phosphatase family protein/NAD(P)/FAD-dependent oxidoreductase [Actibacterium sp. XHP0104]|uniref:bifunctional protein tyrosine phosphatase family protein/NAD(P)/FAD-dependent oxidoreductase n=1 Tax=Actibacterium sp. XHP0104 TaxID=2984335 RepID=UPI0021E8BB1F|nr:bifunctional protein tyrosine phosphatase family protein/NAD(P)/FAD-dependent oxidoreductase [Actibacterium sp. XHP0104]MCV2881483.1 bifunctional protein tyrosine phosphatase family protein/NAD(P)/FAD-dependent oxidoreductase [Actibacterium sp. XHP0104]
MEIRQIAPSFAAAPQITVADVPAIAEAGYKTLICNRPDGEADDQTPAGEIAAAAREAGLEFRFVPIKPGVISDEVIDTFDEALKGCKGPILAYCRTGTRSSTLWALARSKMLSPEAILNATGQAGYDLSGIRPRMETRFGVDAHKIRPEKFDILIVGGGAGGVATAASILKRRPQAKVAIIEPREEHYYQPGWTLVGAGVFNKTQTVRRMSEVIPDGVQLIRGAVAGFDPDRNEVALENGARYGYDVLVVCPGLRLAWEAVEGLPATLGKNGVTSNYRFDLAPYTYELVQQTRKGRAIFTQPPMPIKCAGAPQKAMYLSADYWLRTGVLKDIDIEFCNAGGVLFGVPDYVPALMEYVQKYDARLGFFHNLIKVDGEAKVATFEVTDGDTKTTVEKEFDMLHVCPPQTGLDFIKASQLTDAAGWVDVDQATLRHTRYGNIFGLGDGCNTPNAKTAAAVRKQAPVVAVNALAVLDGKDPVAAYDGYGSCPLTVERGKIVLAEFGYGGALLPSFPDWLIDGKKPSRLAWFLKERMLPPVYWSGMFRGHEYLAQPQMTFRKVGNE